MREPLRTEPQAVGTHGKQTLPEALAYASMGGLMVWLIVLNLAIYWYRHDDAGRPMRNAGPVAIGQTGTAGRAGATATMPPATASSVDPA